MKRKFTDSFGCCVMKIKEIMNGRLSGVFWFALSLVIFMVFLWGGK